MLSFSFKPLHLLAPYGYGFGIKIYISKGLVMQLVFRLFCRSTNVNNSVVFFIQQLIGMFEFLKLSLLVPSSSLLILLKVLEFSLKIHISWCFYILAECVSRLDVLDFNLLPLPMMRSTRFFSVRPEANLVGGWLEVCKKWGFLTDCRWLCHLCSEL